LFRLPAFIFKQPFSLIISEQASPAAQVPRLIDQSSTLFCSEAAGLA
jgi:hypothetical protein